MLTAHQICLLSWVVSYLILGDIEGCIETLRNVDLIKLERRTYFFSLKHVVMWLNVVFRNIAVSPTLNFSHFPKFSWICILSYFCIQSQLNKLAQICMTEITFYKKFPKAFEKYPKGGNSMILHFIKMRCLASGWIYDQKNRIRSAMKIHRTVVKATVILNCGVGLTLQTVET